MIDRPPIRARRPARLPALVALAAALASSTLVGGPRPGPAAAEVSDPPSIVLIVTDDQRPETLSAMPTVTSELVRKGVKFKNAFAVSPLCCPSRTSLLTGGYSHSTGVWRNQGPHGGFHAFDDDATLATALDAAGYDTALVGKYLGNYEIEDGGYVPPGWDRWYAFAGEPRYKGYALSVDGTIKNFGYGSKSYSTDVLGAEAERFIRSSDSPLMLMFTPLAPHRPAKPAARHKDMFATLPPHRPPDFNEADVGDKPEWVRERPSMDASLIRYIDSFRRRQFETLQSVDEAVARILRALEDTGRLSNTLIVYTTDNSAHLGEHRWIYKAAPYEESIKLPFVARYDALALSGTRKEIVLNIDVAPTVRKLTGTNGLPYSDGRNLLPLLSGTADRWRREFLIEHGGVPPVPLYCGLRTRAKKYVLYTTGEQELYKLRTDPYELNNVARDSRYADLVERMRKRTLDKCRPRPPGFRMGPDEDTASTS